MVNIEIMSVKLFKIPTAGLPVNLQSKSLISYWQLCERKPSLPLFLLAAPRVLVKWRAHWGNWTLLRRNSMDLVLSNIPIDLKLGKKLFLVQSSAPVLPNVKEMEPMWLNGTQCRASLGSWGKAPSLICVPSGHFPHLLSWRASWAKTVGELIYLRAGNFPG